MAKERRDSKNRLLGKGEYQKEDGRYMYRYTDSMGKTRFAYSWTLTKSDRTPKGKTHGPCLRDLEIEIERDLLDNINTHSSNHITVNDYFEKYLGQKRRIKATTKNLYRKTFDTYLRDRIGLMKLSAIKYSDVKKCYNDIIDDCGLSISTMGNVNAVLKPVFKLAVRDNLIRNNPADDVLKDIAREKGEKSMKKVALTIEQQNAFLKFLDTSTVYSKWKNFFTVMLGTGCRIGELCGLTWDDCDFLLNEIHINRTICHYPDENDGKYRLRIQSPKSDSGLRTIPMIAEVKAALQDERIKQLKTGMCTDVIDGVFGFVFCNRNRQALVPRNINNTVNRLVNSYNKREIELAAAENRQPIVLPNFSPHILRHTFCTRLCESGMNIKVIQDVMGHSNISITLDIYNSVTPDFKASAFKAVDGMFKTG